MKKNKQIINAVFGFSILITIVSTIAIIFPALLVALSVNYEISISPFELGAWAIPFFIVNIFILGFGLMYFYSDRQSKIRNAIKFIQNFEISKKVTLFCILIILAVYIVFTIDELNFDEKQQWGDYSRIEPVLERFPYLQKLGNEDIVYVKNSLLFASLVIFDNVKVMPFLGAISLSLMTYFFTQKIAQKRFSGIVAMIILLQSSNFLLYDTAATYSYFWVLFYLLSLYFVFKTWYLSPVFFILSIFSKPLSLSFLPLTLFLLYRADIPKRKKILIFYSYMIILAVVLTTIFVVINFGVGFGSGLKFDADDFIMGFTAWVYQLRDDLVILLFLLPLIVTLFLRSRKDSTRFDTMMVLITGTLLLSGPLLAAFTDYNIFPYRYVPFIVFFAIGVGFLVGKSKTINLEV